MEEEIKKRIEAVKDNLLNPFSAEATKQRIIRLCCNEYLRNEIKESELVMKKKFTEDYDYINRWWKKKAIKRYTKLLEQGRIKDETLFYNDMFNMTWKEAREKYISEVGR